MTDASKSSLAQIGARLRAHRLGQNLTPEILAERIGISRAALYRAEKGEIAKLDMLTAIGRELNISLPSLLGVGVEYIPNAVTLFERMRQIEENAEQIIGLFSPISYLVTTEVFDRTLRHAFETTVPDERQLQARRMLALLEQRKAAFRRSKASLISIISISNLERYLLDGVELIPSQDPGDIAKRRHDAAHEIRHMIKLLREPDFGVQLGISSEPFPSTSFEIVRAREGASLIVSPFRLGHNPNIAVGVGLVTSAPEAINLHEDVARNLWEKSMRGERGAEILEDMLSRHEAL